MKFATLRKLNIAGDILLFFVFLWKISCQGGFFLIRFWWNLIKALKALAEKRKLFKSKKSIHSFITSNTTIDWLSTIIIDIIFMVIRVIFTPLRSWKRYRQIVFYLHKLQLILKKVVLWIIADWWLLWAEILWVECFYDAKFQELFTEV